MKTSTPWLGTAQALALAMALVTRCAWAQAPATADPPPAAAQQPLPPASAPATRPPVRQQSGTEERAAATMPGDLRPENPVVPQLKLPLRRGAAGAASAGAPGTIDDTMARCKAMPVGPARTDCLRKARITAPAR